MKQDPLKVSPWTRLQFYLGVALLSSVGAAALLCFIALFSACQTGLKTGAEVVCTKRKCYVQASPAVVAARCAVSGTPWDGGQSSGRAVACTVLRKNFLRPKARYAIWFVDPKSIPHEEAHIEIYESNGFVFIPESHKKAHGFGLGKEKKRL